MHGLIPVKRHNLLGGTNFGVPPMNIKENELAFARNFKPVPPGIRTRGGTRKMAESGASDTFQILGFQATEKGGQWAGLLWGSNGIGYVTGSPLTHFPIAALAAVQSNEAWSVAEWQRTLFGARPTNGLLMARLDPSPVATLAGISPPTFVAVAADGAAGVIPAGNYSYVFTYYDSLSGTESSYGPASNTLAHAANLQINVTGLVASTNPRVDSIRIYRTFPGGTDAWYLVATIPHTQVSYADNIAIAAQGQAASATNGLPPSGIIAVVSWMNRLWVTDGQFLYPSKIGNPEAFDPGDVLSVGSPADAITGLLATDDALVVGRRQGMSYVTGSGRTSWFIGEADATPGLVGPHAITKMGKEVFWLSDNGLYRGSGMSQGVPVSGDRLRPWFGTQLGFGTYPTAAQSSTWALGALPTSDGVIFTTHVAGGMFFYHIPTDSFWPWRLQNAAGSAGTPLFFATGVDADGRDWGWTHDDAVNLVRLDDDSYYFDDLAGVQEDIAQLLVPAFVNLGRFKGLIDQVRVQWSGTDPKVEGDPDVPADEIHNNTLVGEAELRVYRNWHMSSGSQRLQEERTVLISPKQALGKRDQVDEWKAYALKITGEDAIPSNTLGVSFDLIPASGDRIKRPLWIWGVEYDVLVTDLPEDKL